ncbi:hypothetical protein G9C98_002491 [Cotesia typhae]|uniref:Transcription elongation factor 1 homolog n=1 Tax=Cotesia typhae TaxID=2053667 RepID=A0A8J5R638_9HYME|nr:hypothetical protein G9C98_002491 [Cotesia typhae]
MNHNNNTIVIILIIFFRQQTKWDAKRVKDRHRQDERISNLWRHNLHAPFVTTKNHVRLKCKDKARKAARICCRICLEDYQTTVNVLSDPLDVYNDWIDSCDAAN